MLLPISRDTSSLGSFKFVQPHGTSEMDSAQKVVNETHRGMKSRHLTMIGMYLILWCCRLKTLNLLLPTGSYGWYDRYWNILECGNCASIELTFITLRFIASRLYQQAVLQVPFSLMLFLAYSFTVW